MSEPKKIEEMTIVELKAAIFDHQENLRQNNDKVVVPNQQVITALVQQLNIELKAEQEANDVPPEE